MGPLNSPRYASRAEPCAELAFFNQSRINNALRHRARARLSGSVAQLAMFFCVSFPLFMRECIIIGLPSLSRPTAQPRLSDARFGSSSLVSSRIVSARLVTAQPRLSDARFGSSSLVSTLVVSARLDSARLGSAGGERGDPRRKWRVDARLVVSSRPGADVKLSRWWAATLTSAGSPLPARPPRRPLTYTRDTATY